MHWLWIVVPFFLFLVWEARRHHTQRVTLRELAEHDRQRTAAQKFERQAKRFTKPGIFDEVDRQLEKLESEPPPRKPSIPPPPPPSAKTLYVDEPFEDDEQTNMFKPALNIGDMIAKTIEEAPPIDERPKLDRPVRR